MAGQENVADEGGQQQQQQRQQQRHRAAPNNKPTQKQPQQAQQLHRCGSKHAKGEHPRLHLARRTDGRARMAEPRTLASSTKPRRAQ